jgi:hypothetical protein
MARQWDCFNRQVFYHIKKPSSLWETLIYNVVASYTAPSLDLLLKYSIKLPLSSNNASIAHFNPPLVELESIDVENLFAFIQSILIVCDPTQTATFALICAEQLDRRLSADAPKFELPRELFILSNPTSELFKGKEKFKRLLDTLFICAIQATKLDEEEWDPLLSEFSYTFMFKIDEDNFFKYRYELSELRTLELQHLKTLNYCLYPSFEGLSEERTKTIFQLATNLSSVEGRKIETARLTEFLYQFLDLDTLWYLLKKLSEHSPWSGKEIDFYRKLPNNFHPYVMYAIHFVQFNHAPTPPPDQSLVSGSPRIQTVQSTLQSPATVASIEDNSDISVSPSRNLLTSKPIKKEKSNSAKHSVLQNLQQRLEKIETLEDLYKQRIAFKNSEEYKLLIKNQHSIANFFGLSTNVKKEVKQLFHKAETRIYDHKQHLSLSVNSTTSLNKLD